MEILKGEVSSVNASGRKAKVTMSFSDTALTPWITVPAFLDIDTLIKGATVAYVLFEDATGVILAVM